MQFSGEELEQMMAEMAEAQASVIDFEKKLNDFSATVVSKDRMVSATVDAQGGLSGLKLTGRSWRELAAKELTTKIVEVVAQAQNEVRQHSAALFADLAPEGVDPLSGLPEGVDLESMMNGLVSRFGGVGHE